MRTGWGSLIARTQRGPAGRKVRPSRESIVYLVIQGGSHLCTKVLREDGIWELWPRLLIVPGLSDTVGIVGYSWENASRNPHTTGRSKALLGFTRMVPYPYLHLPTFHNPSSVCVLAIWCVCSCTSPGGPGKRLESFCGMPQAALLGLASPAYWLYHYHHCHLFKKQVLCSPG